MDSPSAFGQGTGITSQGPRVHRQRLLSVVPHWPHGFLGNRVALSFDSCVCQTGAETVNGKVSNLRFTFFSPVGLTFFVHRLCALCT